MSKFLNSIPINVPKSNVFDLTHEHKLSANMGQLIPVLCMEAVPGDKITLSQDCLLRMMPMVFPVMHRVDVHFHRYKVPMRLLWKNFEKWITNAEGQGDLPDFPTVRIFGNNYGPLADHLGIPNPLIGGETVNAMPFAAYQLIWQEYYRDQNLQPILWEYGESPLTDGPQSGPQEIQLMQLRKRCWEHDYFTSSLPFAQKGSTVDVPLGDVTLDQNWQVSPDGPPIFREQTGAIVGGDLHQDAVNGIQTNTTNPTAYDPLGTLQVEPTTINELRVAFAIQKWYEKAARTGSRFIEWLKGTFGVTSSDARLQRPEWIGGEKKPVIISEVLNMTGTDNAPQGAMAGHGVTYLDTAQSTTFVEEPSIIMVIMSVMPKTGYQQGLDRLWTKILHPTQYYTPDFAHIGEQEVLRKEVYAYQGDAGMQTFGYMPRYSEYRILNNRVSGQMRTTLAAWHLNRIFDNPPLLNSDFVECDPSTRIFAVDDDSDKLIIQIVHHIRSVRRIPKYGVPLGL